MSNKNNLGWFRKVKIQLYHVRVWNTTIPHQLSEVIETFEPKHIIPVHVNYLNYILKISGRD